MIENVLANKSKISIYANDTLLKGVIDFSIKYTSRQANAYEILNNKPFNTGSQESAYVVTVKEVGVDKILCQLENFKLTFTGNEEVIFKRCNVNSMDVSFDETGKIITTAVILGIKGE